jgi:O-antigen ligase
MLVTNNVKQNTALPMPSYLNEASPTPWAHRFTLLATFVYVAKIANLFPQLTGMGVGKILIGAAIAALILEGGGWKQEVLQNRILRPFLWMIFFALIGFPFGAWPGNSFGFITDTLAKEIALVFLLILTTRTEKDAIRVMWALVINALILDYALFKYGVTGVAWTSVGRNEIAMITVIALGLLLPLKPVGIGKLIKATGVLTLIAAVLFSGSRGGYLGLSSVLATFVYFRFGKKLGITLMALTVIGYVVYIQLPDDMRGNVDSIINYEQDYNATSPAGRMEIWKRGIKIVYQNPILGVGIDNFAVAESTIDSWIRRPWMTAHNSPLQVAAEIGIPAAVFYLILIGRMFSASKNLRQQSRSDQLSQVGLGLLTGLVGYAVSGFFLSQGYSIVFYILMAMSIAATRIAADLKAKES